MDKNSDFPALGSLTKDQNQPSKDKNKKKKKR